MGRVNARDAGRAGLFNPQIVLQAIILGLCVGVIGLTNFGLWVSHSLQQVPAELSKNPFVNLASLIRGTIPWTPVATWSVVAGVAMVGIVAVGIRKVFPQKKKTSVDKARKNLASRSDIESLSRKAAEEKAHKWLPAELATTHPGLRLGRVPGTKTGLYSTWEDLYLIIFGPRMGKTTSQVIPAIVDAPGVVLTTSNKRDIVDDTAKITASRGEIYVFDPQRIAEGFEQRPWFFDPLDTIRRDPAIMDAASIALADIFKTAALGDTSKGDAYFSEGGRDLLARMFLAATLDNRPITDAFLWLSDPDDKTPLSILVSDGQWPLIAEGLRATYALTERTRSGVFGQALQMAAPLGRKETARWVTMQSGAHRFDADAFVRSQADTLYVLSKEGADNAAALTTALTAAVLKAAERYGEQCGGRLPIPLVAALDEAANVVKWPELPQLYSHYGSRSIILMTILQSYAQGVGVWGEDGMEALWSAAAILLYGGGVRDEKMLTKLEALIGEYQEWSSSVSISEGKRTVSSQKHDRKILTVAELASMGNNQALVFASKRRPLVAQLEPYWLRSYWPDHIRNDLPQAQG